MKLTSNRIFSFMLAAAFALTLAGCGGGGGSAMDDDGDNGAVMECTAPQVGTYPDCMDPPPSDDERIATAQGNAATAATAARTAATTAAGLPEADDTDTAAAIAEAATAATAAETAKADADAATDPAVAEAAATAAETAEGDADAALATAMTASGAAVVAAADAEAAAKVVAATKSAGTKTKAITAEDDQTDDAGLGGANVAVAAIAHKDGAVSIAVSRGTGDAKVDFMKAMDLTGADGSTGSMNVLGPNDDGETEIAIVYTDIQKPDEIDFAKVMNKAGDLTQVLNVNTNMENDTAGEDGMGETFEAFAIDENEADVRALVKTDAFTAGTVATLTFTNDDSTTDDKDEAFEEDGTYNGADGTYRCNSDNAVCTVSLDAKGVITGMTDGWIFTPAKGAKSPVPDYDYLHYGAWLMKTAQDDGSEEYNEVQTFANSSLDASTTVDQVEGSASYKGGAAGLYVRNVYVPSTTGEKELDFANSGHFTAAVDLMVYFSQTTDDDDTEGVDEAGQIAPRDLNTVSGTIDGFTLSGGEDASGWGVNVAGTVDGNGISGTAKGGGAGDGSISGDFHGDETDKTPKVLVGEFNAEFTNGSVAGGFGARRQ